MSNTLERLKQFADLFNSDYSCISTDGMLPLTEEYTKLVESSYHTQFCNRNERQHIGLSEIGKPAVLLGLKKLGVPAETINNQTKLRFHFGDVFEALIVNMLQSYGMPVENTQKEVSYKTVPGHIDGVVCGDTVLEVKTMSSSYFQRFLKEPNDDRGYLTQLNMYAHLLNLQGAWLCLNKETFELAVLPLTPNPLIIERAKAVIEVLPSIETFNDLFDTFEAPEAVPEYYYKKPTGKYLIPEAIRYSKYAEVFYDIQEEKNGYGKVTRYVTGYKDFGDAFTKFDELTGVPF